MELEIYRTLVASTVHMTKEEGSDHEFLCSVPTDVGCIVSVKLAEGLIADETPASPGVQAVLAIAKANDCQDVRFDRDGPEIEGVPTYEW